jgi:N-acetylglucosaminyldiphosphoundecaprenol N-acetyl-beta-D-mannosaminyltransferase
MLPREIDLFGIPIHPLTLQDAVARISELLSGYIVTVNPETYRYFEENEDFREAVLGADLRLCDAVGVQAGLRMVKGARIPRVSGADLATALLSVYPGPYFLLGSHPEVVARAASRIRRHYPVARVCGAFDGYSIHSEEGAVRAGAEIAAVRPRFVFVGLGIPRQEIWMLRGRALFDSCVAVGVGGALDVLAGITRRAPRLVRAAGLEWMWRIGFQPSRLPRFFNSHLPFAAQVASASLYGGRTHKNGNPA